MSQPIGIPNYEQLRVLNVGREIIRGTKVTKTNKWYGKLALTRHHDLAESDEFAGTFFGRYTPVRGAVMVDGTYYQPLSYEDPHLLSYAVEGKMTPTDDGNTTHGYTYPFRHTGTRDDRDTASVEAGYPGMAMESEGLMFPEFTISSDIDDAQAVWKFNSRAIAITKDRKVGLDDVAATSGTTTTFVKTAWGQTIDALIGGWAHFKTGTAGNLGLFREILDNDATSLTFAALPSAVTAADTIDVYPPFTAGITDRDREMVKGPGTTLTLNGESTGGRFISFSVTANLNAAYKRFMDNVDQMSNKQDLGMTMVSGQVRLEWDRKREWEMWKALSPEDIVIQQLGTTIDSGAATKKAAKIEIFNAQWNTPTEDVRGHNVTCTWPFWAYVDTGEACPAEWTIKNKQSTMLA